MTYTKLSIHINSKNRPPYFMGSQLRGAFGYALKKVTCINPSYQCEGCFSATTCLYFNFYEASNISPPYRFDFRLGADSYDFDFYLFEESCHALPYVISAFDKMLREIGLGKEQKTYEDFSFFINDNPVNTKNKLNSPQEYIKTFEIDSFCPDIRLKLLMPLRMKKNNRFIRDDSIELFDIINSIYQRKLQLTQQKRQKIDFEIEGEVMSKNVHYKELTRKSHRQKSTMKLGGIMGTIEIKGLNKESYKMLKLGELIGVGKSCVFGLGKIKVEDIYE